MKENNLQKLRSSKESEVKYSSSLVLTLVHQFSTVVENVKPVVMTTEDEEERTTWEVTSSDSSGCQKTETFDSVFVCSG